MKIMKTKYNINFLLLFAVTLLVWCCNKEDDIVATEQGSMLDKYEFPQGNDTWDQIFESIYKSHGVQIIYKEFSTGDWGQTWLETKDTTLKGERFETAEELTAVAEYMKKFIFDPLKPEMTQGIFRPYIYLIKNMEQGGKSVSLKVGMDNWAFCPMVGDVDTEDYASYVYNAKIVIFTSILKQAFERGKISLPESFYELADYTTETRSYYMANYYNDWENLWSRRGFYTYCTIDGVPYFPRMGSTTHNVSISTMQEKSPTEFEYFVKNILTTKDLLSVYFEDGNHYEKCPLLLQRTQIFVDHMKDEYGIDLLGYQTSCREGYTGSEPFFPTPED